MENLARRVIPNPEDSLSDVTIELNNIDHLDKHDNYLGRLNSDDQEVKISLLPSKKKIDSSKLVFEPNDDMKLFTHMTNVLCAFCVVGLLMTMLFMRGYSLLVLTFAFSVCCAAFIFAKSMVSWSLKKSDGNSAMRNISDAIKDGAEAYLYTQYGTISIFAVLLAIILFGIYLLRGGTFSMNKPIFAFLTALTFLFGCFCSGLAGFTGVWVSVRLNVRVASAAARHSESDALLLAFRGGAISSVLSSAMCILGISFLYELSYIFYVEYLGGPTQEVPMLLAGYGFGASFVALFMQLGGGIYTKAADIGADLCGKIEKGIPEDDQRNPAVIADLVGDNVGDCAGSMADVFESIAAEMIGTMILGGTLAKNAELDSPELFVFFPLVVHTCDLIVSGIGILFVEQKREGEEPLTSIRRGYVVAMVLAIVLFTGSCKLMLSTECWWYFSLCGLVGIITSWCLIASTQYYTDYNNSPVQNIATASKTGHATNILEGLSVGLESTAPATLIITVSVLSSYYLGIFSGIGQGTSAGIFGVAMATMGMLCTAVFVLSMNNFGPIADNAGGVVEMSGQSSSVRIITDKLDAVGNVTKAQSKGYAVGGSALACFVLFQAFLDEVSVYSKIKMELVNFARLEVMVSALLGITTIYLFTAWSVKATGRTAQEVVWEVRRQFQAHPGILDWTVKPNYHHCVKIVAKRALREMLRPALLALCTPVLVGVTFRYLGHLLGEQLLGAEALACFLLIGMLSGLIMAVFLDNAGGAWDNCKKLVVAQGAEHSAAHQAAVTGDTVGDPLKDTAGPAIHVIMTTMSTTALVLVPLFINN